ncbi:hypothetical protein [Psychroserpens luteus]|uniref:Dihydrolipoamide dehydrogenase n=1 Tax=Psychroserpens luteus TaxID=1434066 RepID=A0ABW6A0S2_9FLAO|nr:hypothetical protein [Psychroserpens luteus]
MKKILALLFISTFLFTACEGEQGPPGFDGGLIVSSAFEISVDFTQTNNYEFIEAYGFQVYPSDVTLVYILWDTQNGQDIWRLLPQTVEFIDGNLTYNYDFTQTDVRFFLDGTTNFNLLGQEWTQNQVFRVVVVPADNVDGLDTSNLDLVMQANTIESFNLR